MDEDHQQVLSFDDHRNYSNCGKEGERGEIDGGYNGTEGELARANEPP